MSAVQLDVWSDYVCPFCYLAEPALKEVENDLSGRVRVQWRAFELRPHPAPTLDPQGAYLRDIWNQAVYPMAQEKGLTLRLPPVQPRSRLAHEATAYARVSRRHRALQTALFEAFFQRGEDIGERSVVLRLAGENGLDPRALETALEAGLFRPQVLEDERVAQELGLQGVPAIVVRPTASTFEHAVVIEGVQPYEIIVKVVAEVEHLAAQFGREFRGKVS